jgi:hypothetical protein
MALNGKMYTVKDIICIFGENDEPFHLPISTHTPLVRWSQDPQPGQVVGVAIDEELARKVEQLNGKGTETMIDDLSGGDGNSGDGNKPARRDNRLVLFKNNRRKSEKSPPYGGSGTVAGVDYWASAWLQESQKGTKYYSIALRPKDESFKRTTEDTGVDDLSGN